MSAIREKFRQLHKVAREKELERKEYEESPLSDSVKSAVYALITLGYRPRPDMRRLQGATDAEIAETFAGINQNSLRWARWSLGKAGWVKPLGNKRSLRVGKPKMEVYVSTGKKLPEEKSLEEMLELETGLKFSPSEKILEEEYPNVIDVEFH